MSVRGRERGVAMLTAILLVALAAILATAIAFHTGLSARRGASSFTVEQGLEFGAGAEYLAAYALSEDARRRGAQRQDFPGAPWNVPLPPTEVTSGMTVEAKLDDESGKFNLNSLLKVDPTNPSQLIADEDAVALLRQLLVQLQIEPRWADLITDWIDPDSNPRPDSAEDNVYLSQKPPYRAANQYITSVSELLALPEFGRERYAALSPNVTALPPAARPINVCFASRALLDAIESEYSGSTQRTYGGMSDAAWTEQRNGRCFPTMKAVLNPVVDPAKQILAQARISESSQYFRLHTWVTIGTTRFALYSLMKRDNTQVTVLSRTFGTE